MKNLFIQVLRVIIFLKIFSYSSADYIICDCSYCDSNDYTRDFYCSGTYDYYYNSCTMYVSSCSYSTSCSYYCYGCSYHTRICSSYDDDFDADDIIRYPNDDYQSVVGSIYIQMFNASIALSIIFTVYLLISILVLQNPQLEFLRRFAYKSDGCNCFFWLILLPVFLFCCSSGIIAFIMICRYFSSLPPGEQFPSEGLSWGCFITASIYETILSRYRAITNAPTPPPPRIIHPEANPQVVQPAQIVQHVQPQVVHVIQPVQPNGQYMQQNAYMQPNGQYMQPNGGYIQLAQSNNDPYKQTV